MLRTLRTINRINIATQTNVFIYYFKRIPLLGKILSDRVYAQSHIKAVVAVFAGINKVFLSLFGKALSCGLLLFLPILVLLQNEPKAMHFTALVQVAFFLSCFVGPLMASTMLASSREKFICIRIMGMAPRSFMLSTALYKIATNFLYTLPCMAILSILFGGTLLQGLLLTVLLTCFACMGEAFHLLLFSKTKINLPKKVPAVMAILVVGIAAAFLPVLLHKPLPLDALLLNIPAIAVAITLAALCVYYLVAYRGYSEVASATTHISDLAVDKDKLMGEARFADVKIRDKDFAKADLVTNRFADKKGYAYLNAIFFDRHKRLLIRPVLIELGIVAALFLAGVIAQIIAPSVMHDSVDKADNALPAFVFLMYVTSIAGRLTKAMFYNCDISLLRYSYYREKNVILRNFRIRLTKISIVNLIPAVAISAAFVGLMAFIGVQWTVASAVPFVLSILCLSLFFSVHHLFMYYVFQPYTTELGMKNPLFNIINGVVYMVCFACLQLKGAPSYFALLVLASTILYMIVALVLIYRLAPKNFRVK